MQIDTIPKRQQPRGKTELYKKTKAKWITLQFGLLFYAFPGTASPRWLAKRLLSFYSGVLKEEKRKKKNNRGKLHKNAVAAQMTHEHTIQEEIQFCRRASSLQNWWLNKKRITFLFFFFLNDIVPLHAIEAPANYLLKRVFTAYYTQLIICFFIARLAFCICICVYIFAVATRTHLNKIFYAFLQTFVAFYVVLHSIFFMFNEMGIDQSATLKILLSCISVGF